ncbi:MAG: tetratricopeptide repeat protein, partial [Nitrososphaera sp.]|nr:tetratricopeptide repeat protein [Nitrososphaera sp.]
RALKHYDKALLIDRAVGNRRGEAVTLNSIGVAHGKLAEYQEALDYFNQALPLQREVDDHRSEAITLSHIGTMYLELDEKQKALDYFNQALPLQRGVGDRRGEAITISNIGRIYNKFGETQKALEYYHQAIRLSREVEDRSREAVILYNIALAERNRGNLDEACTQIEAALTIIDSLRIKVVSPELRTSFLASMQHYYGCYIDLLMRLHQLHLSEAYTVAALEASERARSRSLLEMLTEGGVDIRQGVDSTLLEREHLLQQLLNAKAERLTKLLSGLRNEEQTETARTELDSLVAEYQEVEAQIRTTSPRYAALTQPQPLSVKEIQEQILDENTILLEYALGGNRSFLWAVTPTKINSFELPNGTEID